jgi:FAD/FMN-containing dehydrogenase
VVTEFVLQTHPMPANVTTGEVYFYPTDSSTNASASSWAALAEVASRIPDLMDAGYTGTVSAWTGSNMQALTGQKNRGDGVASVISLTGFNITAGTMNAALYSLTTVIRGPVGNSDRLRIVQSSAPTVSSYWATTKPDALASRECGVNSLMTSRLLGRKQLTATPRADVARYLQQLVVSCY